MGWKHNNIRKVGEQRLFLTCFVTIAFTLGEVSIKLNMNTVPLTKIPHFFFS